MKPVLAEKIIPPGCKIPTDNWVGTRFGKLIVEQFSYRRLVNIKT